MLYRDTSQGVKAAAGIYTHAIMFPNQLTRSKLMLNSRAAGEIVLNKIAPMGGAWAYLGLQSDRTRAKPDHRRGSECSDKRAGHGERDLVEKRFIGH